MKNLKPRQRALVLALTTPPYPKIADAAQSLGIPLPTAYEWVEKNEDVQAALDDIRTRQEDEARAQAANVIREMVPSALKAKASNLKADSAHVRHLESTWVLERLMGKTADKIEHTGKDGGAIEHHVDLLARLEALWDRPLPPRDGNVPNES